MRMACGWLRESTKLGLVEGMVWSVIGAIILQNKKTGEKDQSVGAGSKSLHYQKLGWRRLCLGTGNTRSQKKLVKRIEFHQSGVGCISSSFLVETV